VDLNAPWIPDGGTPEPRLWTHGDGDPAFVAYYVAPVAPTEQPLAVLRFPICQILKFGYPNDEALPGHPLYAKGLRHYNLFEVLDSTWIAALADQNLVAFPNPRGEPRPDHHFVITFHDSTFECIADHLEGRYANSWEDAFETRGAIFDRIT
jgi:hypothetical protein